MPRIEQMRICNALTRWCFSDEGYYSIRWQQDTAALRRVMTMIDNAVLIEGAESDEDICDDLTAWTYSKLRDFVSSVDFSMRMHIRDQRRLGTRAGEAYKSLLQHCLGSLQEAMS